MNPVAIVKTGGANLASVQAALSRGGADCLLTEDPNLILTADFLVLPGVGAFGHIVQGLRERGIGEALRERFAKGRPTLAICLGLQLLAEESEECPDSLGLGILSARATRFPETLRCPQLGWNEVKPETGCRLLEPGFAYFANSYKLDALPEGWQGAFSDHGGPFVAAVERGDQLACQFHPELSGAWGQDLINRWLNTSQGGVCVTT